MYKVYIHKTTTDGRVFYIGCGQNNRPYETKKNSRSKEWFSIYENEGLIVEIILETDNKDEALEFESTLIQKYKRICDGGTLVNNALYDSRIGKILSDEAKKKMSESHKGKKHSDTTKQKIRAKLKGRIFSDEHKQKLNIPILQYSKDGSFIKEWKSGKEAGDTLNINKGSITQCCKGKLKSTGGFVFRYK